VRLGEFTTLGVHNTKGRQAHNARVASLDGLRGIAIFWVVAYHLLGDDLLIAQSPFLAVLISFGWMGVTLFFSLSGYLITANLVRTRDNPDYFSGFIKRRATRLLPLYLLLLVSVWFTDPVAAQGAVPFWTHVLFLQNFAMASLNTLGVGSLRVTWSLAVEIQFYILIMLLIRHVPRRRLTFCLICLVGGASLVRCLLVIAGYSNTSLVVLMPARVDAFASGALVACLPQCWISLRAATVAIGALSAAVVCAFAKGMFGIYTTNFVPLYYLFVSISSACLVSFCISGVGVASILRVTPLVNLGRTSYFLYLFHLPFSVAVAKVFGPVRPEYGSVLVLIGVVTCWSFANLSWRYLETPLYNAVHERKVVQQS
jgi:peptidoglycan/LPS O-acetylase OafA/YrhL